MAKKVKGLEDLFTEELQDLLDVEKQLVRALPKMVKSASDEELANALSEHLEVTKGQVERLGQVFESLDMKPKSRPCKGMKGILDEGQEMLQEDLSEALLDSAITGSARKVEHYEMVAYESVSALAEQLGKNDAAKLLRETLQEETHADQMLAKLSKKLVKAASQAEPMESESMEKARPASRSAHSQKNGKTSHAGSRSSLHGSSTKGSQASHELTDREEIQQWAEERGARPSCVRGTGGKGDIGMLRLDFPGYTGEDSLEEISWDDWFAKFDENNLALLVQEKTAGGQKSNFNKLVSRGSAKTRSAH